MEKGTKTLISVLVVILVAVLGVLAGIMISGTQLKNEKSVIGDYFKLECTANKNQEVDKDICPVAVEIENKTLELLVGTYEVPGTWSAKSDIGFRDDEGNLTGSWVADPTTLVGYDATDKPVGIIGGSTTVYKNTDDYAKEQFDNYEEPGADENSDFGVIEKTSFQSAAGLTIYKVHADGVMGEYVMFFFGHTWSDADGAKYVYNTIVINPTDLDKYEDEVLAIIDSYKK